jgi:hypothetical protein
MPLPVYMVILMATGLIAIPPASIAHGISAGHMSVVEPHHNDRDHDRYCYSGIYFGPPYGAYGFRYYDADYCYTPTASRWPRLRSRSRTTSSQLKKPKPCCNSSLYFGENAEADKTTARRLYQKTAAAATGRALATALFDGI